MPAASLQSRIQAFEALSSSSSKTTSIAIPKDERASSPSLLESPISPTASTFRPIVPFLAPSSSNRSRSPSPSTPNHVSQTSLIDLGDWILEDGPTESPSVFRHSLTAGIPKLNGVRESSRTPSPSGKPTPTNGTSNLSAPLINFESPPKQRPPLPPRKPTAERIPTQPSASTGSENGTTLHPPYCFDSLAIEHTYPPGPHKFGTARLGHASASSISSFHSVSLSSDGSHVEVHSLKISNKPPSITIDADSSAADIDTASIAESFENVSAVSPSTALSFDWEHGVDRSKTSPKRDPPGLPYRPATKAPPVIPPKPLTRSISTSSSSTASTAKTRRPPPLPPYQPRSRPRPSSSRASVISTSASTSDRSSIVSDATKTSRTSISTRSSSQFGGSAKSSPLMRPTPVPPAARLRYGSLFDSAVQGRRKAEKRARKTKLLSSPPPSAKKSRQTAGWRGLSVDLITSPEGHPVLPCEKRPEESDSEDEEEALLVTSEDKLNGQIVKHIWSASRLDRQKLRSIWVECDPQRTGLIDRDAFVRGMWQIDEELRRAQLARRTSALTAASTQRIPHRPLLPPRPR